MCQEDDCRDCGGGCHCDKDEEIVNLKAQLVEANNLLSRCESRLQSQGHSDLLDAVTKHLNL